MDPSSSTSSLRAGHVGINVTNIDRSRAFYERALGLRTVGGGESGGSRYAYLGLDGAVLVTLWEQSSGRFDAKRPGLHHMSFETPHAADLDALRARLREMGSPPREDRVMLHGEGQDSGGVFFEDPDGTRIEVYASSGVASLDAKPPLTHGPACGFF